MVTSQSVEQRITERGSAAADQALPLEHRPAVVFDVDRRAVRGLVFDTVEGQGRFIAASAASSTMNPPISDSSIAIRRVIEELESQTGTQISSADGSQASGIPVGRVAMTGQPARAVRLAIVPTGSNDLTPMLAAVARSTTTIVRLMDRSIRTEDDALSGTLLEAGLRAFRPEMVILLAGPSAQADWSTIVGTLGGLMPAGIVGQVVVLAPDDLQQQVIKGLGDDPNLMGLDPGQYESHEVAGAIELELQSLYSQRVGGASIGAVPGRAEFVSRVRALDLSTRFMARKLDSVVASAVIGDGTVLNWSTAQTGAMTSRPDLDLSENARGLLGVDPRLVTSQLPFHLSVEDLTNWLLNHTLRPQTQPDSLRDQIIHSAAAAALIQVVWRDIANVANQQADLIIGGPSFAYTEAAELGVLSLLNGFQPTPVSGLVEVILDAEGILTAAGAIGEQSPALAADVIGYDLAVPAASVIVVEGDGVEGAPAVRGRLEYESGDPVTFEVPFGSLRRLPLQEGEQARLFLSCDQGFSVGGSAPGEEIEFGGAAPLNGGIAGLIIDARGRPVPGTSEGDSPGTERARQWLAELGIQV